MAAAAHGALREVVRSYKAQNPGAASVALIANIGAYKKRPRDFAGYETRAVALFLTERESVDMSNAVIAARLSRDVPGYEAPANILTAKLKVRPKRDIQAILQTRGITLRQEQLTSLSKIKRALRAVYQGKADSLSFDGTIIFTPDAVIVSERSYPIQTQGKHRRIHAGKAMLNVDGLKALLNPT